MQLEEIKDELARLSTVESWAQPMTCLMQLSGVGMLINRLLLLEKR